MNCVICSKETGSDFNFCPVCDSSFDHCIECGVFVDDHSGLCDGCEKEILLVCFCCGDEATDGWCSDCWEEFMSQQGATA